MGKFFTTVHIKCKSREQFTKDFEKYMKSCGFVSCDENEAAVTHIAAFSENGWITLPQEESGALTNDVPKLAAALKTVCIAQEVVDSDFAILDLYDKNGGTSKVIVGDGTGYGVEKTPFSADEWKPLIQNGDIEKFLAAIGRNSTFVEDDLAEIGGLLGISGFAMTAAYDEFEDGEDVFKLSFAKAGEKRLSLNAAFIRFFGERLEPLGFKKVKCSHPYYIRVVGGEVVHIITYRKLSGHPNVAVSEYDNYGQYEIIGKVETIYSRDLTLETSHLDRDTSFLVNKDIYVHEHIYDYDYNYISRIAPLPYNKRGDEKQLKSSFAQAFEETKQYLLRALESAVDLQSYIEFCYKFNKLPYGFRYKNGKYDDNDLKNAEGLVHIKVDTSESFFERSVKYKMLDFDSIAEEYKRNIINNPEKLTAYLEKVERDRKTYIENHTLQNYYSTGIFNDKEWCGKALEELERRRQVNTEYLRSLGLDL